MSSIYDKTFCLHTLTGYHAAVYAGDSVTLAEFVVTDLLVPQLRRAVRYALLLTSRKEPPSLKAQFVRSHLYLRNIGYGLGRAFFELRVSPRMANHDVLICTDLITKVMYMLGRNQDVASKTLIEMIMKLKKLFPLGIAATQALAE
ncbi:uncharacterized protein LOC17876407 [Capsella rubella]|nr:uncharacterized protein LOC17876407 [Capsella rubella]